MKATNIHTRIDELITNYLSGGLGTEELTELEDWLKASPENQKYFRQIREVWFSTIGANEEHDTIKKQHSNGSFPKPR